MPKIAIIGTREADAEQISFSVDFIKKYIEDNHLSDVYIYSGNAEGMDQVATKMKEHVMYVTHFLPWKDYNKHLFEEGCSYIYKGTHSKYDSIIYEMFPWIKNKPTMLGLIRRNMFIILGDGYNMSQKVDVVFYYTGKGIVGGTAYGIKTAQKFGIKIIEIPKKGEKYAK